MLGSIKLHPSQWKRLTSALSTIGQAIVIFSLAAIFVPEAVGLPTDFSKIIGFIYLFCGLIIIVGVVILAIKEE